MSPARGETANDALDVLDDRRLDAFGRLVEDQQPRPRHQRARDCQLLLLAAGEVAAAAAAACPSAPETKRRSRQGHGAGRAARRQIRSPGFRATVRRGKISRPCGTSAKPARAR